MIRLSHLLKSTSIISFFSLDRLAERSSDALLILSYYGVLCLQIFVFYVLNIVNIQGPPRNLPMSIYPISSIVHPNKTLV